MQQKIMSGELMAQMLRIRFKTERTEIMIFSYWLELVILGPTLQFFLSIYSNKAQFNLKVIYQRTLYTTTKNPPNELYVQCASLVFLFENLN